MINKARLEAKDLLLEIRSSFYKLILGQAYDRYRMYKPFLHNINTIIRRRVRGRGGTRCV